jgi:hypothetical protein
LDKELETESLAIVDSGTRIVVSNQETLDRASEILCASAKMVGVIEAFFKPLKEKAHAAHKAICNAEKEKLEPHKRVREYLDPQVSSYLGVQKAIREAEEARIAREIEDNKVNMAADAEKAGNSALAESILSAPSYSPVLTAPKIDGIQTRKELRVEVYDRMELIRAVASGMVPIDALIVNESYLKSEHRNTNKWFPGVRFRWDTGISVSKK